MILISVDSAGIQVPRILAAEGQASLAIRKAFRRFLHET
jgi:hypothetical protein